MLDADGVREQSALLRQRINEIDGLLKAPDPSLVQELVEAKNVEAALRTRAKRLGLAPSTWVRTVVRDALHASRREELDA